MKDAGVSQHKQSIPPPSVQRPSSYTKVFCAKMKRADNLCDDAHVLSGSDRSRHSSDQHPKNVNSENSNYCLIFVREFLSSRRKTPRCGTSVLLECLNFCPTHRETPEPPGDGKSDFLSFLSFVVLSCSRLV